MFKKIFTFVFAALLVSGISYGQQSSSTSEEGMAFDHGNVAEIFAKAKAENKYIFVDAYADWCGPCKWMVANVFPQKEVGEFYNANFISYKFDMEKGEGPEFAKQYKVMSYPTYLFFSPDGELVHRSGGSKEAALFIEDGQNALNPDKSLFGLETKYKNGDRSSETLYNYAVALSLANMDWQGVTEEYLATQSTSDLTSEKNWGVIQGMVYNINSPAFKYLEDNSKDFIVIYGEDEVNKKLNDTYIFHYLQKNDFDNFGKYVEKVYPTVSNNWQVLNEYAWNMYEGTDKKEHIELAAKWAKRSMEIEQNYYNTDTYAAIQYKLGNYKEADKYADIAIELAKKNNEKYDGTLELKEMIKIKKK